MSGCDSPCKFQQVVAYLVREGFLEFCKVAGPLGPQVILQATREARESFGPAAMAILLGRYLKGRDD